LVLLAAACTRDPDEVGTPVASTAPTDASADASGQVASVDVPQCPQWSDEHICMLVYNRASGFSGIGQLGNLPLTMNRVVVHKGRYHWGPTDWDWRKAKDGNVQLDSGRDWRLEVHDDKSTYAHADFFLDQSELGTVQGWAYNDGGHDDADSYGGCRGSDHLWCSGWKANGSESPDQDATSYGYVVRSAPLILRVENAVPSSTLTVDGDPIVGGPKVSTTGTDLAAGSTIESWKTRSWSGWRSYSNNGVNTLNVTLRLTGGGNEAWSGSLVTIKVRTDDKGLVTGANGSACVVEPARSTGTQAKCSGPTAGASADVHTPIRATVRITL
jgi:hypothetical protein